MGTVGLDWQIIGIGNFSSVPDETGMVMRNAKTDGFEVYDISNVVVQLSSTWPWSRSPCAILVWLEAL